MDYLTSLKQQYLGKIFLTNLILVLTTIGCGALCIYFDLDLIIALIITVCFGILMTILLSVLLSGKLLRPIDALQKVISFAVNSNRGGAPPDIENLKLGRELVVALADQVYNLASSTNTPNTEQVSTLNLSQIPVASNFYDAIPLPLVGIDSTQKVTYANSSYLKYINKPKESVVGKPLFDSLNLNFSGDDTFDSWLKSSSNSSVTATKVWERVRHVIDQDNSKQFDMVAGFSSGSSTGTEATIALFDRTDRYSNDDQEIGFVALAVHELRTPLTIMRGYIEVFEDELGPTLNPELTQFMHKMHASAQQLAAFVGNILNVARIEENQLALKLRSENIKTILDTAVEDLQLRAQVHNKNITLTVADNLPPVAADRISVHEVINNLVDNAIKYSGQGVEIAVNATLNADNLIEVSVKDSGIGIPASVMGELFQKFHRSHKSSVQVGGTGLGLYLCKALITAHGGNIWVRSKEGEGSIFSFTLIPYDQLSAEQVEGEDGIIRGAHGWIKNHSLYRN